MILKLIFKKVDIFLNYIKYEWHCYLVDLYAKFC